MSARTLGVIIRDAWPWLAVAAVIGVVDYVTPRAYAFALRNVIPIFPAAWRSRAVGFVVAGRGERRLDLLRFVQRPTNDFGAEIWNDRTPTIAFARSR